MNDSKDRALTYKELLVLQALAEGCRYGFEVMSLTDLSAGTVYPILRRAEAERLVCSEMEDIEEARAGGHPRRRFHTITAQGYQALSTAREALLARHRALGLIQP